MKKQPLSSQPSVTRGTLAKIAKEMKITRSAVHQKYHNGDAFVVNRVAQIEKALLKKRRQAAINLAKALGA
jgi:predicted DNA-binding protein YlxM (UPF0122 family)